MKPPVWLLSETILALHERLLAEFGGAPGLRDEGGLDSALARPKNRFAYGKATIFDGAASYAFSLVKNHPFVDGNKRIGFVAAVAFLEINGYRFQAPEAEATIQTLALAAGALTEAASSGWLKARSVRA